MSEGLTDCSLLGRSFRVAAHVDSSHGPSKNERSASFFLSLFSSLLALPILFNLAPPKPLLLIVAFARVARAVRLPHNLANHLFLKGSIHYCNSDVVLPFPISNPSMASRSLDSYLHSLQL